MTAPATEPRVRKLGYHPALDGIRGVAILAAIAYHANYAWAAGGFLGVDMFFVLSGYLITSLLVVEWDRTSTVHFAAFWARRARRLLPALFLVLVWALRAHGPFRDQPARGPLDRCSGIRCSGIHGIAEVS